VVGDERATAVVPAASPEVGDLWRQVAGLAGGDLPTMGLGAGERPAADVEVLCSAVGSVEFELARRMAAAARAGSLPLVGDGAMLTARGWSAGWARRLARCAAFVEVHPCLGGVWASGVITSEHVHALARCADRLTVEQMAAVITELSSWWGQLSPAEVAGFVARVIRVLTPPPDPDPDEVGAHAARSLSFALTADAVVLSGVLPRLEGEAVVAAIDAFAERLRSEADHVPASARRADGLVALVNAAHATGSIPTRGGLPVSVSVTLDSTALGDQVWTTSRGHTLTDAEARFTSCDAMVTPIVLDPGACPDTVAEFLAAADRAGQAGPAGHLPPTPACTDTGGRAHAADGAHGGHAADGRATIVVRPSAAARIAALATTLLETRIPLAVGRTARTATPAQRRALAARDKGCIIPGCGIPADACQTHHVEDWAADGNTDLPNLALLCWAHHRQVDLGMWTIVTAFGDESVPRPEPGAPPGTPWPANHGAPWTITRTPRTRWRP
jgi:hypothetical protein